MATRGRKPKPTHLRLLTGNPGKRKIKRDDVQPELALPMPPPHLSDEAKVEWGRMAEKLYRLGLLSELDVAMLAGYCQAYGRWVQAERAIEEMAKGDLLTKALMVKTTNGNAIQNPLVGTANKALELMSKFAAEFGMSPSSRVRLSVNGEQAQANPTAKYFD